MTTALLVIDMQAEMEARLAGGQDAVNPGAGAEIAALQALFRARGLPVIHVHHHAADPGSAFHPDAPGARPMAAVAPRAGEAVFVKATSSAFEATGLEAHLRARGISELVICGAVAGFCVTSAVRSAADRGFGVILPQEAVLGFDLVGPDGGRVGAAEILRVTLALLAADFARVVPVAAVPALIAG